MSSGIKKTVTDIMTIVSEHLDTLAEDVQVRRLEAATKVPIKESPPDDQTASAPSETPGNRL